MSLGHLITLSLIIAVEESRNLQCFPFVYTEKPSLHINRKCQLGGCYAQCLPDRSKSWHFLSPYRVPVAG